MGEAWKRFIRTQQGGYLKEFFSVLEREIANNNKSGSKGRESILLLNTRKGYWIHKIYQKENAGIPIKVFSDRYLQKSLDFDVFCGKIIYLVDDTLVNGYSLLETYELLAKKVGEDLICPIVFALSDTVNLQQKKESAIGISGNFWNKLKYYLLMSDDEINELCILETQLIHAEGIPNMIDLPFLKDACRKTGELDFQFHLTKKQFQILQKDRKGWTFHFNSHTTEDKNALCGFIMQLRNEQLLENTKEFVHDLVMEGTYIVNEDESVLIVFTPFAILKSMSKAFLLQLRNVLFDRQEDDLGHSEDSVEDRNRWIRYHRECVYVLSMMVAECFCREVADDIGIRPEYDYEILKDHFPENMILRMQEMENVIKREDGLFYDRLKKIFDVKNDCAYGMEDTEAKLERKSKYSEAAAYNEVWQVLKKKKDDFIDLQSDEHTIEQKLASMLELGQMEKLLDKHFEFESNQDRRYALTRVTVTILRSSVCSNKLEISPDGKCLIRGFRYGENSDLLLPFFDVFFYWAVLLLISKREMAGALRCYGKFVAKLRRRYEELMLLSNDAEKINFELNCDYYKRALERKQYIYNKFCFVQSYLRNQMTQTRAYYMRKMEEFVEAEC